MIATESRAQDRRRDRQRDGRPPVLRAAGGLRPRPELSDRDVLRGAAARLRSRQPDEILRTPRRRAPEAGLRRRGTPKTASRLHVGDRATAIDRERRVVISQQGREVEYDAVVLATGSAPFVPAVPGVDKKGVFVYRTIEDLERILAYAGKATSRGGDRRRPARARGRQGGPRPRARDPRRRVRPAADASPGRRRGLEDAAREDRGPGRPGPPGQATQEFLGNGKVEGLAFADGRRARRRHGRHLGGHPPPRRAGPRLRPGGRPARRVSSSTTACKPPTRTSSPSARSPGTAAWSTAWSPPGTRWPTSSRRT